MASAQPSSSFIMVYDYVDDIMDKRTPYREEHLKMASEQLESGKLVCAGAKGDPVDGGLFIFKNTTKEEVEAYIKSDPYVINDLVTNWTITPYMLGVGGK